MNWLLTLILPDGRIIRASQGPISVPVRWPTPTDAARGGPHQYPGLLLGIEDFESELDFFSLDGVGSLSQAKIELVTTTDLAAVMEDWHHFSGATGELATIEDGQDWEDRVVLLGLASLQNIEIGRIGEPTTFTLESLAPATGSALPIRVAGGDFTDPLTDTGGADITSLAGISYPRIYGKATAVPALKAGAVLGNNRLLIAGHHFANLGSITIYEDGAPNTHTPLNGSGATGDYCYIDSATDFLAGNGAYTSAPSRGGLAKATDLTTAAEGAGDILRILLGESGVTVDWDRQEEALRLLDGWTIGFYVDEPSDALSIIRDRLLPILPLVEIQGPEGLYYAYAEPWRRKTELDLIQGQNIGRSSKIKISDLDAIRNKFTVAYGYDPFTREYASETTLGPDEDALCYLSDQIYGEHATEVKSTAILDEETAVRVARAMAGRLALPRRVLTYHASPDLRGQVYAGMVVTVTDSTWSLNGELGVISRMRHREAGPEITVEIMDRTTVSR